MRDWTKITIGVYSLVAAWIASWSFENNRTLVIRKESRQNMVPYLERTAKSFLNHIMSQLTLFTIRLCNVTIESIASKCTIVLWPKQANVSRHCSRLQLAVMCRGTTEQSWVHELILGDGCMQRCQVQFLRQISAFLSRVSLLISSWPKSITWTNPQLRFSGAYSIHLKTMMINIVGMQFCSSKETGLAFFVRRICPICVTVRWLS